MAQSALELLLQVPGVNSVSVAFQLGDSDQSNNLWDLQSSPVDTRPSPKFGVDIKWDDKGEKVKVLCEYEAY